MALKKTVGSDGATVELDDLNGCDMVFLIGANPASNHPRLIHKLQALRERGGHVVVINPAREPGLVKFAVPKSAKSMIAGGTEIASIYLQPKIGSDIYLMKGIARAVLARRTYDGDFIKHNTHGFRRFATDLKDLEWEEIEEKTGLMRSEIQRVAKLYGQSQNTIFTWGMGVTHHEHGVQNVEYISNLALLRGMVGRRYAGLLPLRGHSNVQGIGTIGVKPVLPDEVLALMEDKYEFKVPVKRGLDTLACLERADRGKIDFALFMGGNLFSASPDTEWTRQALNKIKFKVFLTTTLNQGHVNGMESSASLVLPVAARDEEVQATTQESMFNYVRLSEGGISRYSDARPETDILVRIAKSAMPRSLVPFEEFRNHKTIRQAIASVLPEMAPLGAIDDTRHEFHIPGRVKHSPTFDTEDQKARFVTRTLEENTEKKKRPFTLTTVRSEGQFNTIVYEERDAYRDVQERWAILMNANDIERLKIHEGDRVIVKSNHGKMTGVKVYEFDLPVGNVMMYFPEANVLIGRERDIRSKTPAFKNVNVSIKPE